MRYQRYFAWPIVFAASLGISSAAELNSAAVTYKLPDQIPWSAVDARGSQKRGGGGRPVEARLLHGLH